MSPDTLFGTWQYERRIFDRRSGMLITGTGQAMVSATRFKERGQIQNGHTTHQAQRRYVLDITSEIVHVQFPDGRLFIDVSIMDGQMHMHQCGDDLYRGKLILAAPDTWLEMWSVRGPRKAYLSLTRYQRAD